MSGFLLLLFPALVAWFGFLWRPRPGSIKDASLVTPSELAWAFGGPARVVESWQVLLEAEGCLERSRPYLDKAMWKKAGSGPGESADEWLRQAWVMLPYLVSPPFAFCSVPFLANAGENGQGLGRYSS